MRVLLSHRFFWPDTAPYGSMLRSIGAALVDAGHEVSVVSSRPSYGAVDRRSGPAREDLGGLDVRRGWVFGPDRHHPLIRLLNVVWYCGVLFRSIVRLRPDVVTASTFPPVVAAWTAGLAARMVGARFVYHLMDVHPEVSIIGGGALGRPWFVWLQRLLDDRTLRRSDAIVVLSDDMADTIRARDLGPLPIHVINNFLLDEFDPVADGASVHPRSPGLKRAIFAGNLGRFQNLDVLAAGVVRCLDQRDDLELLFLGEGVAEEELRARWGDHPRVHFASFLPFPSAKRVIAEADIGLLSLRPGLFRVAYPSKLFTYLGLGVPVVALVEPESALATEVASAGLGTVAADPTPEAVADAVDRLLDGPDLRPGIRRWAGEEAGAEAVTRTWVDLVADLGPMAPTARRLAASR